MISITQREQTRQQLQAVLDNQKTAQERNQLGQYATPFNLATDILSVANTLLCPKQPLRFLDPACGTGVFFSSFCSVFTNNSIEYIKGFEIDQHYAHSAQFLWNEPLFNISIRDFTNTPIPTQEKDKFDLIICNPPYVRHHHIKTQKSHLKESVFKTLGIKVSGLAGLYCYFLLLAHSWLKHNGIAGWLIPSEFMDVKYGKALKEYLSQHVDLLHIHRFEPTDSQFNDAIVSSSIVWFRNTKPVTKQIKFTYGGSLLQPKSTYFVDRETLEETQKWTSFSRAYNPIKRTRHTIGDFFTIKRGIATGANSFFILDQKTIKQYNLPIDCFRPILPTPRYLKQITINADNFGYPAIPNPLFLLNCKINIDEIRGQYPTLYAYLQEGISQGISNRYLCQKRALWYTQEERSPSYFYCTYMGRKNKAQSNPFRFLLNYSQAIVSNSYLILYPNPRLNELINKDKEAMIQIHQALNAISPLQLIEEGRIYGGGMYKLEPRELTLVPFEFFY